MASPQPYPFPSPIKALTFDVFGTTVNRLNPVVAALTTLAATKLATSPPSTTHRQLATLTPADWTLFAQQWHAAYGAFTRAFVRGTTPWRDVGTHFHDSLLVLLDQWRLGGVYTAAETEALGKVWHALTPWPDSAPGLARLKRAGLVTSTLSNGNRALLEDLDGFGGLGFQRLIGAEDFKAYKPAPEVYLGACKALGCEPGEVAMVAAHLEDLAAARALGLRTVYVERPGEEAWGVEEERYRLAREWVDLWVAEGEGGFDEVATRLGA
ncbi:haloacid dehalogenase [Trichocladium antarcticum]|uniref:Haloacid dehalogenase n=1 Tax=Trichocladium antarcticum TaxID=1450529 RepID=A0AAN6UEG3_9PEZI|nr:haloacid dehalogenase [Trichocladium antarcticum]